MNAKPMAKMLSKREEGFTLVELVVAMFVIGIVLVSLIGVQLSAMVTITNATKRQMATQYANEAMETLRAMPWDVLNKGNVPGFHTAGGNVDPYYSGTNTAGTVTVDGETYTVRFATSNAQNLAAPRPPLFTSTGANVLVRKDPERQGHEYTIRAYVVNSLGGTAASVGILVIVSWDDARTGERLELALRSSAYPGSQGCGQTSVQPFLSACEDTYGFSATAGYVTTTVVATEVDSTTVAPLLPGSSLQEFTVRSAYVLASAESVQVTSVENKVRRGGVNGRSMPPSATTVSDGFGEQGTEASNDFTSSSGIPADDLLTITSGSSSSESYASGDWEISARSDDGRTGTARSSTTNACNGTALIAGEPCSYINVAGSARVTMELEYDGASIFPIRRYGNASSSAGGGRFVTTKPGSDYGCQTLTSSGCTSGLAEYQETDIRIGAFTTGTWAESPSYLVQIADYSDEVLTQRGHAQPSAGVVSDRTATVRYWDGTTLRTVAVDENSSGVLANTGTVTWSPSAGVTITASASISATPVSSQLLGEDPIVACATDVCGISATTGSISVTVQYRIVTPSGSWDMYQNTSITGSASSSSYSRQE